MTQGPRYALAPVFCIRAAGVPFDRLASLGTPEVAEAARRVLASADDVARAADAALVAAHGQHLPKSVFKRLKHRGALTAEQLGAFPALAAYADTTRAYERALAALADAIAADEQRVHDDLQRHAGAVLPDFLLIESGADATERLIAEPEAETSLNSQARKNDRTLALYLQRVCAKNDTISEFGPAGWGRVVDGLAGVRIAPEPGVSARSIEVERWVVNGLIDVLNAIPAVRDEAAPRRHPDLLLDDDVAIRLDTGTEIALAPTERALLARCDGRTPAHRLGDPAALARLVDAGLAVWQLERYALDSAPLSSLLADVDAWRPGELRTTWLGRLADLRDCANAFGSAPDVARRREVLARFKQQLAALGVAERDRGRTLYAAGNPISENCYREYGFELGAAEAQRVVDRAAPWIDLYRDAYALGVARAFDRYRELIAGAPRHRGQLSYAGLVTFAAARGVELENDKLLVQTGIETFAEIKRALTTQLGERPDAVEWQLAAADCHFLRRSYELPDVVEFAYPQADLQLAAASLDEVATGRARWVIAELHHPFIQLQHSTYWPCPDKPALHAAMAAATAHGPFAVRGSLTEQPVHIAGESVFWALPEPTFVGRGRAKPGWRSVHRADALVEVDEQRRDVRLRDRHSGRDLGSLIRTFRLMMGMHPFFPFERAPHAPRLVLDDLIVQRQTWHVTSAELDESRPTGMSSALVLAIERLRRDRGIPRWVFARASVGKTFDVYARDKDVKPFYVDLESTLFLDIFERRLRKYGEVVLSEMLPAPHELVWSEPSGRVVFELRTSLVPATTR